MRAKLSSYFVVSAIARLGITLSLLIGIMVVVTHEIPTRQSDNVSALLQYTSGGHMLGFEAGKVYLAGLDHALTIEFTGGKPAVPLGDQAVEPETGNAPILGRVTYAEVWSGIDVIYSASSGDIVESTYLLAPGADPEKIALAYNTPVELMSDGSLRFAFETGWMIESVPLAWQDINGQRVVVDVSFVLKGEQTIGFTLGTYDQMHSLTIDPTYSWHTFYGSAYSDDGSGIAVDANGNIYVTGTSYQTWNGPGGVAPLNAHSDREDLVILKLSKAGVYQWHTFYGSAENDYGLGIAADDNGYVYVVGQSNASWSGPGNVLPLHAYAGTREITILKLSSAGEYQWHTFYGSSSSDYVTSITLDGSSTVYLAGWSSAAWEGPGGILPLHAYAGAGDIFVLRLSSAGNYQWHTFYGSSSKSDYANGIAMDGSKNIYLGGTSNFSWNGPGGISPLHAFTEGNSSTHEGVDIFVLKLSNAGNYQWHTFYGALTNDFGEAIATDGSDGVYIAGRSEYTWDGPGATPPLDPHAHAITGWDMVIIKLSADGGYKWHTFYGGTSSDYSDGLAIQGNDNVYLCGESWSTWNGAGGIPPLNPYADHNDIMILNLSSAGAYQWHTFYGGSQGNGNIVDEDVCGGIAVDDNWNIYITGTSDESWDGPEDTPPLNAHKTDDIVVIKMADDIQSFNDVPITYWAWQYIERLSNAAITGGCATGTYCPEDQVTRAQMAVFLEKGMAFPSSFTPPNVTPTFNDTIGHWAEDWIEALKSDGVTSGCAAGLYCPEDPVTRAQMAVFLLKAKHGVSYSPPPATGVFTDVPIGYWADKWIEQLAAENITGGCATDLYCPDDPVTRAQMAVFLVKTFNLP
jgi:hypothetical protein